MLSAGGRASSGRSQWGRRSRAHVGSWGDVRNGKAFGRWQFIAIFLGHRIGRLEAIALRMEGG